MPETNTSTERTVGLLAEFAGPDALKSAAAKVRDAGFVRWDAHSPFPVHGIERAMGIRPTVLPWLVLAAGLLGAGGAILMQWWMNAVDYPLILSGKPLFSLPANIPITFELIVLLSAFAAFFGALGLNRLPQFRHFLSGNRAFRRVTTDGFFISIEATDPQFDTVETADWLRSLGATRVETCEETTETVRLPGWLISGVVVLGVLATLPPLFVALARQQKSARPRIHLVADMDVQPKYLPQAQSAFFADRRTMRLPVAGTVAQQEPSSEVFATGRSDGQWAARLPIAVTEDDVQRGQQQFNTFCAPCHGLAGNGDGMTAVRALAHDEPDWAPGWVPPLSLHSNTVRKQPVGQLFGTIGDGIRTMPGYAAQILPEDRWRIVLYIRALQRSRNATIDDVPEEMRPQLR